MKGPLRFRRREAPIRCGFARTYVPRRVRRHDWPGPVKARYPALVPVSHRTFGYPERCELSDGWVTDAPSGQIRLARVDDRWVREDVHQRRLAGRKGPLQSRFQLLRTGDELAVPA